MAEFMLLLHESPSDFADLSPEEIQRVIGEYSAWRLKLEEEGRLVGGLTSSEPVRRFVARRIAEVDSR